MIDPSAYQLLHVSTAHDGAVVHLVFDHGKANEIGIDVLRELEALTSALEADADARVLISRSTKRSSKGTPIFVAGANVTERRGWDDARTLEHVAWQRDVLARLRRAPVFHVVIVSGVAFGWGTEFLLTADWRIACDGSRFALPETGLGIVPGAGGTGELWAEIGVAQVLRLGMTGEAIPPDEAARIGLVQEYLPTVEAALARAEALAAKAATRSPTAVGAFKRAVLAAVGRPPGERTALEQAAYAHAVAAGEAGVGRSHFSAIRAGQTPPWSPRHLFEPGED